MDFKVDIFVYYYAGGTMDPKRIYEMIVAGGQEINNLPDDEFDVSEMLVELSAVEKAMKELQEVAKDFENQRDFNFDYTSINRKLYEKKIAMEFANVDATYEL
jgi:hypothetical protein